MRYLSRSTASARRSQGDGRTEDYLAGCRGRGFGQGAPNGYACDAVRLVVDEFSPRAVILYGDTARGRDPDDDTVDIVVIVDSRDVGRLWEDILIALAEDRIDANLTVLTPKMYEEDCTASYTAAYRANKTGVIVYESRTFIQALRQVRSRADRDQRVP